MVGAQAVESNWMVAPDSTTNRNLSPAATSTNRSCPTPVASVAPIEAGADAGHTRVVFLRMLAATPSPLSASCAFATEPETLTVLAEGAVQVRTEGRTSG